MTETDWRSLEGEVLDSHLELSEFAKAADGGALFRGRDLAGGGNVLIRLEGETKPSASNDFDRFREAAFLQHPNLIRSLATGRADCRGRGFVYQVTEMADTDLAATLEHGPLGLIGVSELLRDVAAGLAYVHAENLVYCALRASSVWRLGGQWKLADYTQLRVAGKHPVAETRQLMLSPEFEAPPESNEGLVSDKWDIWSLGSMLRKVVLPHVEPDGTRPNRPVPLGKLSIPPPFDRILREALEPDPLRRATLDRILEILSESSGEHAAEPEPLLGQGERAGMSAPAEHPAPLPEPIRDEPVTAETVIEPAIRPVPLPRSFSAPPPRSRRRSIAVIAGVLTAAAAALVLTLKSPSRANAPEPVRRDAAATPEAKGPGPARAVGEPAPEATASNTPEDTTAANLRTQQAISALLGRWAEATRKHDLDAQMNCYAPLVDRYFGQRGLSASRLRSQEQSVFARTGTVKKFEISNVEFNRVGPQWAVVSFDKNWDFRGRTRFSGSAREEFVLRPIRGQWKIASEREVKVYWVNKQAS